MKPVKTHGGASFALLCADYTQEPIEMSDSKTDPLHCLARINPLLRDHALNKGVTQ